MATPRQFTTMARPWTCTCDLCTFPLGVGGLTNVVFSRSATPPAPARGRVCPSPIAPPLGLGGWVTGAPEPPRWPKAAKEGLRDPKMASKMAQGSSRWLKIASDILPKGPKPVPRRLQVPADPSN
eukprot:9499557-Pyramimonas_sp.AAC.1